MWTAKALNRNDGFNGFQENYGDMRNYGDRYEKMCGWQLDRLETYEVKSKVSVVSGALVNNWNTRN